MSSLSMTALACQLLVLLLLTVIQAHGAHTPPSSPPRNTGKGVASSTPLELHPPTYYSEHDRLKGVKLVSSYTITDPDPKGQSISSDNHKGELFVDPIIHNLRTKARKRERFKNGHAFFVARTMDEGTFDWKNQHILAADEALEHISSGHVVRHTNDKQTVLLHHNKMTAEQARIHHNHNFVWDLTHKAKGPKTLPSKAKAAHQQSGTFPRPLRIMERLAMHKKLADHMQEAQKHAEASKSAKKLYWNQEKRRAEPDEGREKQLAILEKFKADNKAKKAASTATSTSS